MILGQFGDFGAIWRFYESIAENIKEESIIEENIDRRININVDRRQANREANLRKL